MLASITPLGERARGTNWSTTSTFYVGGSILGGAAVGAVAGTLGWLLLRGVSTNGRLAVVATALAAGLAWELSPRAIPGPRRQVNEQWLERYRSWVYGLGFGTQLGAGIATVVVTSAVYVVVVAAMASAHPGLGAAIGAGAGALRGATLLASARITAPERLIDFHSAMRRLQAPVRWAALVAQLALAGLAVVAIVA